MQGIAYIEEDDSDEDIITKVNSAIYEADEFGGTIEIPSIGRNEHIYMMDWSNAHKDWKHVHPSLTSRFLRIARTAPSSGHPVIISRGRRLHSKLLSLESKGAFTPHPGYFASFESKGRGTFDPGLIERIGKDKFKVVSYPELMEEHQLRLPSSN